MPRLVDAQLRRSEIAEATLQVLAREGVEALTMRGVADQLGCTTGLLTHWVDGRSALIRLALATIVQRQTDRAIPLLGGGADSVLGALEQFLPLDDERRDEARIWLGFWALAVHDPELRAEHRARYRQFRTTCTRFLRDNGAPARAAPTAVDHVMTAVDGIAVAAVLEPEYWTVARQRRTLRDVVESVRRSLEASHD
jgi:AcrR family transcriptional regulator